MKTIKSPDSSTAVRILAGDDHPVTAVSLIRASSQLGPEVALLQHRLEERIWGLIRLAIKRGILQMDD